MKNKGKSIPNIPTSAASSPNGSTRVAFMDNLRYLMIVLVVLYHAAAAYAIVAPHWAVHDTSAVSADIIRELFDVFLMPILFFAAGYFALPSLIKKGTWGFIKEKAVRLLIPWALAVLIVLPLALYDQPVKPVRPFWNYWLHYLASFEVRLRYSQTPAGITTQAIYWFLSLLFVFFVVFALGHGLVRRLRGNAPLAVPGQAPTGKSVLTAVLVFGVLSSIAYLILLLLVPDSSWFTFFMFMEFQVTRLVPYTGCFALGVYAQSRGWFSTGKPLGSLIVWGVVSAVLAVAYLVVGQPVFADTAGTASFSALYLLVFAFLRSFLLLALLVALVSFGIRCWNRTSGFDRQLSSTSFNIYLVHFFIVLIFQGALVQWVGGPVAAKIAIVFLGALGMSYALSRWILSRHARAFSFVILALFVFCLIVRP